MGPWVLIIMIAFVGFGAIVSTVTSTSRRRPRPRGDWADGDTNWTAGNSYGDSGGGHHGGSGCGGGSSCGGGGGCGGGS